MVEAVLRDDFVWALGSVCALNRIPFDAELLLKQFPPQKGYFDMYYYYYATQVVHFYDGPDWHRFRSASRRPPARWAFRRPGRSFE